MQSQLLATHPQARVRVYAIWTSKMLGDGRDTWDAAGMTDPRVVHLWDERNVAGEWLLGNVDGHHGSDWVHSYGWGLGVELVGLLNRSGSMSLTLACFLRFFGGSAA